MAISFTRSNRESSIIMTEDQAKSIIDNASDDDRIIFANNPKRRGTNTYNRWVKYSSANTIAEYLELNNTKQQYGDLLFAIQRGHIKILD